MRGRQPCQIETGEPCLTAMAAEGLMLPSRTNRSGFGMYLCVPLPATRARRRRRPQRMSRPVLGVI
jgi:hypothetical protein